LIHGLSVIADSLIAIDCLVKDRPQDAEAFLEALRNNFEGYEELRNYLVGCPKFGNNVEDVDSEAADIARRVSQIVASQRNYLGNPFRPDWSSPSTHLLYGYWVGATPDGRKAREQINYGVDPLFGEAGSGMGLGCFRTCNCLSEIFAEVMPLTSALTPNFLKPTLTKERAKSLPKGLSLPYFSTNTIREFAPITYM